MSKNFLDTISKAGTITIPKIDSPMMSRFVNFMAIPQRYNIGLFSPVIWSHMIPKELRIIKVLDNIDSEDDENNYENIYQYSGNIALCKDVTLTSCKNVLSSRSYISTHLNPKFIEIENSSMKADLLLAMLSPSVFTLSLYSVSLDAKLEFSTLISHKSTFSRFLEVA